MTLRAALARRGLEPNGLEAEGFDHQPPELGAELDPQTGMVWNDGEVVQLVGVRRRPQRIAEAGGSLGSPARGTAAWRAGRHA